MLIRKITARCIYLVFWKVDRHLRDIWTYDWLNKETGASDEELIIQTETGFIFREHNKMGSGKSWA
jgi:hypothetical protein